MSNPTTPGTMSWPPQEPDVEERIDDGNLLYRPLTAKGRAALRHYVEEDGWYPFGGFDPVEAVRGLIIRRVS